MTKNTDVFTTRKSCRGCGYENGEEGWGLPVFNLGMQFLTGFPKEGERVERAPLCLALCRSCGLLQLRETTNPKYLYSWYGYRSGVNESMREALLDVAISASKLRPLTHGEVVVDIGSNDGTFLRNFSPLKEMDLPLVSRVGAEQAFKYFPQIATVGFEPAQNLKEEAEKGISLLIPEFFSPEAYFEKVGRRAAIVAACAMFYDVEDPRAFLDGVAEILADDGVFVLQMNYLASMVTELAFDNISHEHVCYYSLTTLLPLLRRAGLDAFDVETNGVNGGSFRIYCKHASSGLRSEGGADRIAVMLETEQDYLSLRTPETYNDFRESVRRLCSGGRMLIEALTLGLRKNVLIYGASTRGLVQYQCMGLAGLVSEAAERNPDKFGRMYSGTGVRCVPEDYARAKADYFLVLPYHFVEGVKEREKNFLERGGKLITLVPETRVHSRTGTVSL